MKNTLPKTLLYILLLLTLLTAVFQGLHMNDTLLTPEDGLLDLSSFPLHEELVQIAADRWEYYPGQLYTPADFAAGNAVAPTYDNAPTEEFGTYRLILRLPEDKIYGITGQGFNFCQRTYINGTLIDEIGSPGATADTTTPRTRTYDYYFAPDETGTAELIFHTSNFFHREGARNRTVMLGEPSLVMRYRGLEMMKTNIVLGCFIAVFLYFIGIFIFFGRTPFLYLALAALFTGLRTVMVGEKHIMFLFPELDWFLAIRAEYIFNILFVVFLTMYFASLFPQAVHRYFLWAVLGFSGVYILMVLFTSTRYFTSMLLWHTALWVFASLYTLICLVRQLRRRDLFTTLIFVGLAVFFVCAFFDEISYRFFLGIRAENNLITGVLLCIFMNMVALTLEFFLKERELAESRVSIMLSQIQPHFLYNSLVAIKQLCDIDPQQAQETIMDFSDYLRGNLDSLSRREPVPFAIELEHVGHYLSIECRRFDEYIHVKYDINCEDFLLPALTLQPIVENAIRHGILPKPDGGTVTISTWESKHAHHVMVADDGVGFTPGKKPEDGRSHIGLENVAGRLRSMCRGTMEIKSAPGEGAQVTLTIPKPRIKTKAVARHRAS